MLGQPAAQADLLRAGAVEMIEFALMHLTPKQLAEEDPRPCVTTPMKPLQFPALASRCPLSGVTPPRRSWRWDESTRAHLWLILCRCMLAVEALVAAAEGCPKLHEGLISRVLGNMRLWGLGAPLALQAAAIEMQRTFAAAKPDLFRRLVGLPSPKPHARDRLRVRTGPASIRVAWG